MWGGLAAALAALAALCAFGPTVCRREPPARARVTVDQLAAALRAHGVAYTVAETAALPRVQAQGLRLTGKGLDVELYRIDDEEQLALAARAAQMAQATRADTDAPLQAVVNGPFLMVVRSEPTPGRTAAALAQALPQPARGAP